MIVSMCAKTETSLGENKQVDCVATRVHEQSCFKKNAGQNAGQNLEVPDATEPIKVMAHELALVDLSWTPRKCMNL